MDIILNPNIAYLVLAFTIMVTMLALLSPGTGVLELVALFLLAVVAWLVYNLGFNAWALGVLFVGVVFFWVAARYPKRHVYRVLAIIALVIGSAFLFPSNEWYIPAVNPLLAVIVSVLMSGYFWMVIDRVQEARKAPPVQDINALIGMSGEARTPIHDEGTVQIMGELWSAESAEPIARGTPVHVTGRKGFTLFVEAEQPETPAENPPAENTPDESSVDNNLN